MEKGSVSLGKRTYDIFVGRGAFNLALEKLSELCSEGRCSVCVADSEVLRAHSKKLSESFGKLPREKFFVVEESGGESAKSFSRLEELCDEFASAKLDRSGSVFALGGGVVGDLAGFAASSYMRGVDFYQVPTTLLAMVDSSVGGKTGINISAGKNLVGAFKQPKGVYADTDFLKTLPPREFSAGMAEVVKYALISDADFFEELGAERIDPESESLSKIIAKCCEMKAAVVASDEMETSPVNGRALLNLGHTFGHAIEKCAGYGEYLHGEAVSIGLVLTALLSRNLGFLTDSDVERIKRVLTLNDLPVKLRSPLSAEEILKAMSLDKKSSRGRKKFVVMKSIGKSETSSEVSDEEVVSVLREFL